MKKVVSWVLALATVFALVLPGGAALAAGNTSVTKKEVSREIAVVFDNSGSMYSDGKTAWCGATYAMEVFAAMMNEGDVLKVFPMWEVTSSKPGQREETYSAESNPIVIKSMDDIALIHNMYTPTASVTPLRTIDYAYNDLMKSTADEKWLLVLTDGSVWYDENGTELSVDKSLSMLQERLDNCSKDVNVQLLAIGANLPLQESDRLHSAACSLASKDILSSLTALCNSIFGRNVLPAANITGNKLTFDVSMSKLIVFVQGDSASIGGLKNEKGDKIDPVPGSQYSPMYSEKGCGNYSQIKYDSDLKGTVVTFPGGGKGTYTLDYSGDIEVYYEPDVSVKVVMRDAEGGIVDGGNNDTRLYMGDYTIEYGLVDNVTGEYTTSSLLGDVKYDARYTLGGEEFSFESGKAIHIDKEGEFDFNISAVYLNDYTVKFTGDDYFKLGQLSFGVLPKPAKPLDITIEGGDSFGLAEFDGSAAYTLKVSYNDEPLTAEQLDQVAASLKVNLPDHISYAVTDASNSTISLALKLKNGISKDAAGTFNLGISATFKEEGTEETVATAAKEFSIVAPSLDLEMSIDVADSYFMAKDLESGKPFVVTFKKNGQLLTDEELQQIFATMVVTLDEAQFACEAKLLPGQSAAEIKLCYPEGKTVAETGSYKLQVKASLQDIYGDAVVCEASRDFSVNLMAKWLKILLIVLGILLLLLIIWLISSIPAMPKDITHVGDELRVGSSTFDDAANFKYSKSGKTLTITTPENMAFSDLPQNRVTLKLAPGSPLRVKSKDRIVKVKDITFGDDRCLTVAQIGKNNYEYDRKEDQLLRSSQGDFGTIKNKAPCEFMGKFGDPKRSYSFECKMKFK